LLGFITADAFENGGAVADDVGEDVKLGVVPLDPFSVAWIGIYSSLVRSATRDVQLGIAEYGRRGGASMEWV
jgi:hypothetical protein